MLASLVLSTLCSVPPTDECGLYNCVPHDPIASGGGACGLLILSAFAPSNGRAYDDIWCYTCKPCSQATYLTYDGTACTPTQCLTSELSYQGRVVKGTWGANVSSGWAIFAPCDGNGLLTFSEGPCSGGPTTVILSLGLTCGCHNDT